MPVNIAKFNCNATKEEKSVYKKFENIVFCDLHLEKSDLTIIILCITFSVCILLSMALVLIKNRKSRKSKIFTKKWTKGPQKSKLYKFVFIYSLQIIIIGCK